MKVLKTIVATAVIVFALTTVAMAGVQHFTKQSGQATGTQAQTAQPAYTVTLTAAQLAQLMNGGKAATAGGVQHARQTQQQAQRTQHHAKAARHQTRSHDGSGSTQAASSGSGGTHHYEATHHASSSTSSSGSHHAETSHHSGGGGDGGSCGD
jgi:type IV secretory pathway TrbL component